MPPAAAGRAERALTHGVFTDLLDKLEAGDLLVFNNTRVIPARMFGRKVSGGKIEVLVERVLDDHRVLAHVRVESAEAGRRAAVGDDESIAATMVARHETLFELRFNDERDVFTILNAAGHMPLPPYIARPDEDADRELYQTVYSEKPGAVAAPTAGLHFDEPLLGAARQGRRNGVRDAARRRRHLPAGARGNHRRSCDARRIRRSAAGRGRCGAGLQARGKRVVAVGTTSVRSLESAAAASKEALIAPFFGDTSILSIRAITIR